MDCLGPSGAGPCIPRTPASDLDDQNSPYLDQAVTLRVKELEDLLEVLHLVLGEPLGLLGHPGGVVGAVVGRWVRVLGHGRKSGLVRHWERPTAPHAAPQPLPPLSYVRLLSRGAAGGSRGATYARA